MAENELTGRENLVLATRMTHNNEIIDVAEVLNETYDPIADATVIRANDITSHVVSRRTSLPTVSWVKVGGGWNASVAGLQQAREEIGMLKARYLCPETVMELQPNPAKYRSQQERPFVEAMGREFCDTLIGPVAPSSTAKPPEEFAGFTYRYSSLSTNDTAYVISNGDSGQSNNTSIWFVQWGPGKVYLIYPRNGDGGGLKKKDEGRVYTYSDDSTSSPTKEYNNYMQWAYITEFSWTVGLCIEDTRCVKRLANIDSVQGETYDLDENKIIQIRNNFKTPGTISMYCNETIFTQLQCRVNEKGNVYYSPDSPFGKQQMMFLDMPVRRCDSITNTETSLT